jgi:hypothetical protein
VNEVSRRAVGLGCVVIALLVAIVLVIVLGAIAFGFLPGRR